MLSSTISFEKAVEETIAKSGFAGAKRIILNEDASTRAYERLELNGKTAILMKAPVGAENPPCPIDANEAEREELGWNALSRLASSRVEAFVAIGDFLREHGFTTPQIYACDIEEGVAVIEDLGDNLFAEVLKAQPDTQKEILLYEKAGKLLARLHEIEVPKTIPAPNGSWPLLAYDKLALRVNADLFVDWVPQLLGKQEYSKAILDEWHEITDNIIAEVLTHPRAFTLRDYHAENVIWLPEREGLAKIGLLDFQDAVNGFRAWDFAMLLHDARRDVSYDAARSCINAYLSETKMDAGAFYHQLEMQGAINAMRILGIFSRLIKRDGKARYREFMPREIGHLLSVLGNSKLTELKLWIEKYAPLEELRNA
ncbi:MAG: aminoglycoside phosphotransferase [Hyphomonadaceae bacterium]|nr:MAG: aminoglycoside phosphotransferase [Hyphomonadaceae bacterium]KAF0186946.1 MAG: aminoglycoside phosphotransferase [Hyphomonadaceae bacterium]